MIAVEKKEPHRTCVWKISQDVLDAARGENEISMDLFLYCRNENKWPTGYETLRVFETI